jgi:uncharacterized protein (TIGR03435 family)
MIAASTVQGGGMFRGGPGTAMPGQWTGTGVTIRGMILRAWNLFSLSQLSGPPSMVTEHYDVAAKIPPNTSPEHFRLMIQHLLADRLGLVAHHETRQGIVYDLVVADGGPRMKEATPVPSSGADPLPTSGRLQRDKNGNPELGPGAPPGFYLLPSANGGTRVVGRMRSVAQLIEQIQARMGRPVFDKTGLTGNYDYVLDFTPDSPPGSARDMAGPPDSDVGAVVAVAGTTDTKRGAEHAESSVGDTSTGPKDPAPNFRQALLAQLWLRLEPRKAPTDILVVDRFNKVPLDN